MSQYVLRGTSGPGDEPNDEDPLSHFSIDMRWEIGYDPQWFTFYAALLDEDASRFEANGNHQHQSDLGDGRGPTRLESSASGGLRERPDRLTHLEARRQCALLQLNADELSYPVSVLQRREAVNAD